jgi:Putative secretion activating protein
MLAPWARDWILASEGGLVNDPQDPGGLTKFGISQRAYPALDIANLTEDDAARIYARDYWDVVQAGADAMPAKLGLAVFDSAVNQGPGAAVRLLQAALRVHVDGEIGAETLGALRRVVTPAEIRELLADFLSRRAERYADNARLAMSLRKFERGWFKRLFLLQAACLDLEAS